MGSISTPPRHGAGNYQSTSAFRFPEELKGASIATGRGSTERMVRVFTAARRFDSSSMACRTPELSARRRHIFCLRDSWRGALRTPENRSSPIRSFPEDAETHVPGLGLRRRFVFFDEGHEEYRRLFRKAMQSIFPTRIEVGRLARRIKQK